MALNFQPLHLMILGLMFTFFFCLDVSPALSRKIVGAYEPIENLDEPRVQEMAKFAVDQHNEEAKTQLVYEKVVKRETQVVAGRNYKLVIQAKDKDASHQYEAVVYESFTKFRNLTSFTLLV